MTAFRGSMGTVSRARQSAGLAAAADDADALLGEWRDRDRSDIHASIAGNRALRLRDEELTAELGALRAAVRFEAPNCWRRNSLEQAVADAGREGEAEVERDEEVAWGHRRRRWELEARERRLREECASLEGRRAGVVAASAEGHAANLAARDAADAEEDEQSAAISAVEALAAALRAAAPDHPLLAPTDYVDPYGGANVEYERLAWEDRARRLGADGEGRDVAGGVPDT